MTAITIANTDWEIVDDVKDALGAATVSGASLFDSVTIAISRAQAQECQFRGGGPNAVVLYHTTVEDSPSPEDNVGLYVRMSIIVARKDAISTLTEATRLQNLLKLINGAKNGVEAGTIANAAGWGDGNYYKRKIEWGTPSILGDIRQPWGAAEIPLDVSYVIADSTSH